MSRQTNVGMEEEEPIDYLKRKRPRFSTRILTARVHQAVAQKEVKKYGFMWKRARDKEDLDEVLKHAANMIYELRTADLTPKQYYTLFMDVRDQLHGLDGYFQSLNKDGMPMEELYRRVQETGHILPRLYLLAVAGAVYIQSKEAAAKHILKDLVEMSKGVQHPMRALFLRDFINTQTRNLLPDVGNDYSGEGGTVFDSIDFTLQNFTQMNKLWVRMQSIRQRRKRGKPLTEKQKRDRRVKKELREKQRKDLKILVGLNLQRLSGLDGVDLEVYSKTVLPGILEQITNCGDIIAQEYLMDLVIHGFPCEYHVHTLEQYLGTCAELKEGVNVSAILQTLMDRIGTYCSDSSSPSAGTSSSKIGNVQELFETFDDKVKGVIDATKMNLESILELKNSQLGFALGIATSEQQKLLYAGHVLDFCGALISASASSSGGRLGSSSSKESKLSVQMLETCLKSLGVTNESGILKLKSFGTIQRCLPWEDRKNVAVQVLKCTLENHESEPVSTTKQVTTLLTFAMPLVTDEDDAPGDQSTSSSSFAKEQAMIAKLVQSLHNDDLAVLFKMYHLARKAFGKGGKTRIKYTLVPLVFAILKLVNRVCEAGSESGVKLKKLFQFIHDTIIGLASIYPDISVRLFLHASLAADTLAGKAGEKGSVYSAIAYEFVVQALIVYEEMANSKQKKRAINEIIASLYQCVNFSEEEYENLVTRVTQHAAKLIKKPDQCEMVQLCCHLFWTSDETKTKKYTDTSRVLACLQRCLKIADKCMGDHTALFVNILNSYLYFYQNKCPTIKSDYISGLVKLIKANHNNNDEDEADEDDAFSSSSNAADAKQKKMTEKYFRNTMNHIRNLQNDDATAEAFQGLKL